MIAVLHFIILFIPILMFPFVLFDLFCLSFLLVLDPLHVSDSVNEDVFKKTEMDHFKCRKKRRGKGRKEKKGRTNWETKRRNRKRDETSQGRENGRSSKEC